MPIDRGASSKVILANLSTRTLRRLQSGNAEGQGPRLTMTPTLRAELRAIRTRGYCVTEAELDPGVRGIAVPIFQPDRTVVGSLSLVVAQHHPSLRDSVERLVMSRGVIEAGLIVRSSVPPPDSTPV